MGEGAGILVGGFRGGRGVVVCGWRDWDEKLLCRGKGGCNGVVRGEGWW